MDANKVFSDVGQSDRIESQEMGGKYRSPPENNDDQLEESSTYVEKAAASNVKRKPIHTVIGIDFGNTKCIAAVMQEGKPVKLPCIEGNCSTPSVVGFSKTHDILIGLEARNQAVVNPKNTIASAKRYLGRKLNDPEIQKVLSNVPYIVTGSGDGGIKIICDHHEYTPPQLSALILRKLKVDAETYLGGTIYKAVIAVPTYFDDAQRKALIEAANIAGLEEVYLINESTALALAYGFRKSKNELIAVYDLGSGNFNFSIIHIHEGVFGIESTIGNTILGGDDFDERIVDYLVEEFEKENYIDLCQDYLAMQRLREAAEKAKIELSNTMQTEVNLPFISANTTGPKHLVKTLTRAKLEELTADLVEVTLNLVRQALKDAGRQPEQIDEIVLAGGMSRMPAVQEAVIQLFGRDILRGVRPDEFVAFGAAIQAGILEGVVKHMLVKDVTPLTLSLETTGGVATELIPRNTTIPASISYIFTTARKNQMKIVIHLLQGDRVMARDNQSLGRFILEGIPPASKGIPRLAVTFEIDASGIIKIYAQNKNTGCPQNITAST